MICNAITCKCGHAAMALSPSIDASQLKKPYVALPATAKLAPISAQKSPKHIPVGVLWFAYVVEFRYGEIVFYCN